jgi:Dolichyl-phosphate-mannose-protein mannosyltransferase
VDVRNAPLWGACALVAALSLWGTVRQLVRPYPIHAWEAGLVADGWRSAEGMPVYEDAATGHATHMYGPLSTWSLGRVFRVTGPCFWPARVVSVLAAWFVIAWLVWAFRPPDVVRMTVVMTALLLGFGRVVADWAEPRPDALSWLLALAALVMLYRGFERQAVAWHAGGLAALVLAFLFKQPAAMVAPIPLVAVALGRSRPLTVRRTVMLVTPLLAIAAVTGALALGWPVVFHYVVEVPAQFAIPARRLVHWGVWLPLSVPLVWLAVAFWLREHTLDSWHDPRLPWLVAVILVAAPAGVVGAAKIGGTENSLAPAFFALVALGLHASETMERTLRSWRGTTAAEGRYVALIAVLLVVSVLDFQMTEQGGIDATFGGPAYPRVVEVVRGLEGTVASPQDPSIVVMAKGTVSRSLAFEQDHAGWPAERPAWFLDELPGADWVVTVGTRDDWRNWPLRDGEKEEVLRAAGFEPVVFPGLEGSLYGIWRRAQRP